MKLHCVKARLPRTGWRVPHLAVLLAATVVSACAAGVPIQPVPSPPEVQTPPQPTIVSRTKPLVFADGLQFKDLNANGQLDAYEDWRLSPQARAQDLVARMTLPEKAGTMLIASSNPGCGGVLTDENRALVIEQEMSRFILRSTVTTDPVDCTEVLTGFAARSGYRQNPGEVAAFTNAVQELREATRLGIPALFKDNARNHVEVNPMFGITQGAGAFTEFPKEAGLAAAALGAAAPVNAVDGTPPAGLRGDMGVITGFTGVMGQEWRAIGLRGMYGYMADLGTEPRWSRFHETFSEDADLVGDIMAALVSGLQGPVGEDGLALSPRTSVSLTLKHFPGGGPQQLGLDPHYTFGKNQFYTDPSGQYGFEYHLRPFVRAIEAGVGAIMPYYGVPVGATYEGDTFESIGLAFSEEILTGLLRDRIGFAGYINSDSGIIEERGWGFEDHRINPATGLPFTVADRTAIAIRAGTDVLSEFRSKDTIVDLVANGMLNEASDIDPAVTRLLTEQFALGLFENPYVDATLAPALIGTPANREVGLAAQRQSVVLLQNRVVEGRPILPLAPDRQLYVIGFSAADLAARGFAVVDGNYDGSIGEQRPAVPEDTDIAVIKVLVNNAVARGYASDNAATGGRMVDPALGLIDPQTGAPQTTWGAQDPCVIRAPSGGPTPECSDSGLYFGGSYPWESGAISLSAIAEAESWAMYPTLADIRGLIGELGDARRVVISIYFRNPYVLDEASGLRDAGALLATFGAGDSAQIDILTGRVGPAGRLPFALPASLDAVQRQHPDAPGYGDAPADTLFPFGFGLGYAETGPLADR